MDAQMQAAFEEANKAVHPVYKEWHYPILIAAGFEAKTPSAVGFVRQYTYERNGHVIICSTGVNADHWTDKTTGESGYWSSLEPHVKGLTNNVAQPA